MALYTTTLKKMPDLKCSEESVELRFFSREELMARLSPPENKVGLESDGYGREKALGEKGYIAESIACLSGHLWALLSGKNSRDVSCHIFRDERTSLGRGVRPAGMDRQAIEGNHGAKSAPSQAQVCGHYQLFVFSHDDHGVSASELWNDRSGREREGVDIAAGGLSGDRGLSLLERPVFRD